MNNKKNKKKNISKSKLNRFFKKIGKIEPILVVLTSIMGIVVYMFNRYYMYYCGEFYGISSKYFKENNIFYDKAIAIFCGILLLMYPFIIKFFIDKIDNKKYKIFEFLFDLLMILVQLSAFLIVIINSYIYTNFINYVREYFYLLIIIIIIISFLIAYYLTYRIDNYNKKTKCIEKIVFGLSMIVYFVVISCGLFVKINYNIQDKRYYETINDNKVIVSDFSDKFVVMDCDINDEILIIHKGKCTLVDMTDVNITYKEYKDVICKY